MANNNGRKAITLCGGAAMLVFAVGCSSGGHLESHSGTTTSITRISMASSPSSVTPAQPPPATSGVQTGDAMSPRLISAPGGCVIGLNCGCIPYSSCYTPPRHHFVPKDPQPPSAPTDPN